MIGGWDGLEKIGRTEKNRQFESIGKSERTQRTRVERAASGERRGVNWLYGNYTEGTEVRRIFRLVIAFDYVGTVVL